MNRAWDYGTILNAHKLRIQILKVNNGAGHAQFGHRGWKGMLVRQPLLLETEYTSAFPQLSWKRYWVSGIRWDP